MPVNPLCPFMPLSPASPLSPLSPRAPRAPCFSEQTAGRLKSCPAAIGDFPATASAVYSQQGHEVRRGQRVQRVQRVPETHGGSKSLKSKVERLKVYIYFF